MLNQCVIVGRIAKDVEAKELEDNRKQIILNLAVPRSFKNEFGEYETDFIDVISWNGIAQNVEEYCKKGDLVGIKGRLQSVKENDKNLLSLVAEKVTFLSSKAPTKDNPNPTENEE